jgi:iron complex outermembrane receptor protein
MFTSLFMLLSSVASEPPLERIVITGVSQQSPLQVLKDPKAPQQPLPAQDGADYLKSIPGFAVIRKGGTSGDPVFRGAAGSRLLMSSDEQIILGGCSSRMDPPTAYINPQNFDRIRVIKGPQTILYGPAAATVLFERDHYRFDPDQGLGQISFTSASANRYDLNSDLTMGNDHGFWRITGSYSEADDYNDGSGQRINSAYQRWGVDTQVGWTPDQHTVVILSVGQSGAEAAYADRAMDGVLFDRSSASLRWRQQNISRWLTQLDSQIYYGYVDHVMDNYSLRTFAATTMMPNPSARNPDRYSRGFRSVATLANDWLNDWQVGIDHQLHEHRDRVSMNQPIMPFADKARVADAQFRQWGLFTEWQLPLTSQLTLLSGWRVDQWQAIDQRISLGMGAMAQPNPTALQQHNDYLNSGFVRLERQVGEQLWHIGIGRAERFPDYWELFGNQNRSTTSASAFFIKPELVHQVDVGVHSKWTDVSWVSSLFYGRTDNFILLERGHPMQSVLVRNIDSESFGGETTLSWQMNDAWLLDTSLAYTHASNLTDQRPLAQQPPLELKIGAQYQHHQWTHAALWRIVDNQHRVAIGQGNIVGNDFKASAGFAVLSVNSHWRINPRWQISFGIDNLLDKTYAEHLSTAGAMVAGYEPLAQINEPGRTVWFKLDYRP